MSFQRFGRRRSRPRQRLGMIINSNKNVVNSFTGLTSGTKTSVSIADAQDSATLAVTQDVERGCSIKAIWIEFWITASELFADAITNGVDLYLFKNPGQNLTSPIPGTIGSSNEKKFIFKTWKGIIGARSQGFPPYTWKGWVKIPKRYQRMGANDRWQMILQTTGSDALFCSNFVYKWYK